MFLEICWRDNSHIEFHPARCALRVVSHCLHHRRFTQSGWFVSTLKGIATWFYVAKWGCLCLAAASATVETWTYTFWSFMIEGPLIIQLSVWSKGMFSSPTDVPIPPGNNLPRSRSTRRQQVLRSVEWKRTALFYPGDEPIQISQPSFP